jgi:UDP-N-acetylmuramate--alanine ligase
MESIGNTSNNNQLMSDYGHHPTEVSLTLDAIKQHSPEKHLYVVFQPHQYNRTLELLKDFKTCF